MYVRVIKNICINHYDHYAKRLCSKSAFYLWKMADVYDLYE